MVLIRFVTLDLVLIRALSRESLVFKATFLVTWGGVKRRKERIPPYTACSMQDDTVSRSKWSPKEIGPPDQFLRSTWSPQDQLLLKEGIPP